MESKAYLLMRRPFFLIPFALLCLPVLAFAQQVSLSLKNASLEAAFRSIEKQTGYHFVYTKEELAGSKTVNLHFKNVSLDAALKSCFDGQPLNFAIDGNYIVVRAAPVTPGNETDALHGKVVDEKGEPLAGVTVMDNRTKEITVTDDRGDFLVRKVMSSDTLVFTSVNTETVFEPVNGRNFIVVSLKLRAESLGGVTVELNTGYQHIPKERATGSFDVVSNELINRSVSSDILSRIDGVTSGVLFSKNVDPAANEPTFSIRGRSTIFANPQPLIVVDNFPYDGDIGNINPNDVESITILKDAAAASIWGARSGNGVVVITTKTGMYNRKPKVSANSNITVSAKPDLFYQPQMSSADYIGVEQYLFGQGYYDGIISNGYSALSPVVNILNQERNGQMSAADAESAINALKTHDLRNDLKKYYYHHAVTQQYSVSISGGNNADRYYFSAGYDNSSTNLVRNGYKRVTINANNSYALFEKKLEISTNIVFSSTNIQNNNSGNAGVYYPYASLADASGAALPVFPDYSKAYLDTAGQGHLLDWYDYPLRELGYADNSTQNTEYKILTGLKYRILKGFEAIVNYQYTKGNSDQDDYHSQQTYYTRNLINQFTEIDNGSGNIYYPVPTGGILDKNISGYFSHNVRAQLNLQKQLGSGELTAIAGWELKSYKFSSANSRLYGYNPDNLTSVNVDYVGYYPMAPQGYFTTLPTNNATAGNTDHFISYFANAAYLFHGKYLFSASARTDASNLFGVATNQKTVPLWSAGFNWEINRENFYHVSWLPYLKLKITDGYSGNVNKNVSAYTTALYEGTNIFNANYSMIVNPPNPDLRWERINIVNAGIEFGLFKNRVSGSLEYYHKDGRDIIGNSPLAPQTGVTQFTGNTAGIKGNGLDFVLNATVLDRKIKWKTNMLWSYSNTVVSKYELQQPAAYYYIAGNYVNPMQGKPYSSLFSYKWAGLDPNTGDPQGYVNGHVSSDWASLVNPASLSDIVYNGTTVPRFFGNVLNSFSFQHWEFSFNITYKFGSVFRRASINYSQLFELSKASGSTGHGDFEKRWKIPGDEQHTNVPSLSYPEDYNRDQFYLYSSELVDNAGELRLQNLQLSYLVKIPGMKIEQLKIYAFANNLWLLWKANKDGIDPDYVNSKPLPKSVSVGVKIDF
ncbi:MAG TPA: SusC/RagA family TonB-linked outer membrane protein [Puia sp.]|nr:SusC/RagA family TonB-linked outer membrane protein [Puia sp.]